MPIITIVTRVRVDTGKTSPQDLADYIQQSLENLIPNYDLCVILGDKRVQVAIEHDPIQTRKVLLVTVETALDDEKLVSYMEGALEVGMEPGDDHPLEDATKLKDVSVKLQTPRGWRWVDTSV